MHGSPKNDWEVQVPPWLRHVGPVAIGLFVVLVTLGDYSVFQGFDEREPATLLSLALFVAVAVVSLAAARNPATEAGSRSAAWILGIVSGLAALDEVRGYHEEIGYWVQDHVSFLPSKVKHFTDDVIILGGALAGATLLFWLIRRSGRLRDLRAYALSVIVLAILHGVLDIVSHGIVTLKLIFPDLPRVELRSLEDQLSVGEEYCKIWSGWFALLFVQRFFHRDRIPLAWSWALCCATPLVALSLWTVSDPASGVPYMKLGGPLLFLRNFHGFAELCLVWTAWGCASWFLLRDREEQQAWFALLFPASAVLLAGGWSDPDRVGKAIGGIADALLPNAYWGAGFWAHGLLAILLIGPGLLAGLALVGAVRSGWVAVVAYAAVVGATLVWAGRGGVFVGAGLWASLLALDVLARGAGAGTPALRRGALTAAILLSAAIVVTNLGPRIPNHKFADYAFVFFRVDYQDVAPKRGR